MIIMGEGKKLWHGGQLNTPGTIGAHYFEREGKNIYYMRWGVHKQKLLLGGIDKILLIVGARSP